MADEKLSAIVSELTNFGLANIKIYVVDTNSTPTSQFALLENLILHLNSLYVKLTGNESILGVKTFVSFPVTPSAAPTLDYQVANKKFVEDTAVTPGIDDVLAIAQQLTTDRYIDIGTNSLTIEGITGTRKHTFVAGGISQHISLTSLDTSVNKISVLQLAINNASLLYFSGGPAMGLELSATGATFSDGILSKGLGEFADYSANKTDYSYVTKIMAAVQNMTAPFKFAGQATGGHKILTFSAVASFNCNDGNSQKMPVSGNITSLNITNKVNGGSYIIYLKQDVTGGWTIPTPGASFGNVTDNSAPFVTTANAVNQINVNVDPDGDTYYTVETKT